MKNNAFALNPAYESTPVKDAPHRTRMRRNRVSGWQRRLVAENAVSVNDLIWPVFVIEGDKVEQPVAAMPGVSRWSIDLLMKKIEGAAEQKIPAIALFPVIDPAKKTADGREAYADNNLVQRTVRAIKKNFPDIGVICDVALDPYTTHGHDGLMSDDGRILNDETVEVLCRQALNQADAGVDIVAPSDMMDHRVAHIRDALDQAGYLDTAILAYAAKYASAFYGPFRDAVGSQGALKGDKKTYQMDPANALEALREVEADILEGADMVMVKPGLPYLDIIHRVKENFGMPTFAYHVSGEYAMLKAAAANGWLDHDKALMETMMAFKRAGCDGILTYAAPEIAEILSR